MITCSIYFWQSIYYLLRTCIPCDPYILWSILPYCNPSCCPLTMSTTWPYLTAWPLPDNVSCPATSTARWESTVTSSYLRTRPLGCEGRGEKDLEGKLCLDSAGRNNRNHDIGNRKNIWECWAWIQMAKKRIRQFKRWSCNRELNKGCITGQNSSLSSAIALKVKHKGCRRLSYSDHRGPNLTLLNPARQELIFLIALLWYS